MLNILELKRCGSKRNRLVIPEHSDTTAIDGGCGWSGGLQRGKEKPDHTHFEKNTLTKDNALANTLSLEFTNGLAMVIN